jgi:hypothetical protein
VATRGSTNCQLKETEDFSKPGLDSMNLQTNGTLPLVLFLPPLSVPLICFHRYLNQEYSEESAETGLDSMNVARKTTITTATRGVCVCVSYCVVAFAICIKKVS